MTLQKQDILEQLTRSATSNLRKVWINLFLSILVVPLVLFNWVFKLSVSRAANISQLLWLLLWLTPFVILPFGYYFYRVSRRGIKRWMDKGCLYPLTSFSWVPTPGVPAPNAGTALPATTPFRPYDLREVDAWLASLDNVDRQKLQVLWLPRMFLALFSVTGMGGVALAMTGISHELKIILEIALVPLVLLSFPRVRHLQRIVETLHAPQRHSVD